MHFVFQILNNSFTHSIEFDLDAASLIMDATGFNYVS